MTWEEFQVEFTKMAECITRMTQIVDEWDDKKMSGDDSMGVIKMELMGFIFETLERQGTEVWTDEGDGDGTQA